jgi:hypothetical protein
MQKNHKNRQAQQAPGIPARLNPQVFRIWAHPAVRQDRAIRLNKIFPGGIPPGKTLYRFYPLRGPGSGRSSI